MLFFKKQFWKWQISSILFCFTFTFQIAVHPLAEEVSRNTKPILARMHLQITSLQPCHYCSKILLFGWSRRKLNEGPTMNEWLKNQTWIWKHIVCSHWWYRLNSLCGSCDRKQSERKGVPEGGSNWSICPFGSVEHPGSVNWPPLSASGSPFPSPRSYLDPNDEQM